MIVGVGWRIQIIGKKINIQRAFFRVIPILHAWLINHNRRKFNALQRPIYFGQSGFYLTCFHQRILALIVDSQAFYVNIS
ncbi:MAG: hypothetical protein EBQ97_04795 [Bacteroidetes bacterium]|nr:hypothetical protein [Bacteroidota bacterium]